MRAAPGRPAPHAVRPRRRAAAALLALTLVTTLGLVSGCNRAPSDPTAPAGASPGASSGGLPSPALPPDGSGASTPLSGSTGTSAPACASLVGAQLRERTTVGTTGLVTVLNGSLPCPAIGLWAARFTLDSDPTLDPAPQFEARYTGARQLAVRIPPASGRCAASAVFFTVDADAASGQAAALRAAAEVRAQLASWPARSTGVVPGGGILRGRSSSVLAATVVGNPATCSPGESVSTPTAAVGDCWTALPDSGSPAGTAVAADATRFRRTTCGEPHTHEVYWAENLTAQGYLAGGKPAGLGAAAWARRRADAECARRSTHLELTRDVTRGDIFLEFLWPATLSYPPTGPTGWSKAQIVCLARWQDGRVSDRHLLHR